MPDDLDLDDPLAAAAIRLGREGRSRREIASALGMALSELEALEDGREGFAAAMERAEDEARAWWEALPGEVLAAGRRFDMASWREAMCWRFGKESLEDADQEESGKGRYPPPGGPVYIIPCNGREIGPDGLCPYAKQNMEDWPDEWFKDAKYESDEYEGDEDEGEGEDGDDAHGGTD